MTRMLALLLIAVCCLPAAEPALIPFGTGLAYTPAPISPAHATSRDLDALSPEMTALWSVENPETAAAGPAFAVSAEDGHPVLRLWSDRCTPERTTVRIFLPGDGPANGTSWAKAKANYLSFSCTSDQAATMTCHLLMRGKPAGEYHAEFATGPDGWHRILIPIEDFGLPSFTGIAGIGFRVATAESAAVVRIKDFRIGGLPFSDSALKSQRMAISINGDWHFAADPGDQGLHDHWFSRGFDDAAWRTIRSGQSWQQQGIVHHGYGWYRQAIVIPKECAGMPLTITVCAIPADDDAWFNGERIGGINGEYKYNAYITRSYVVPAALIHPGEANTIAMRIWGGNLTFIGDVSGLIKGPLVATLDPHELMIADAAGIGVPAESYDFSDARQGKPFAMTFSFPGEFAKEPGAQFSYLIDDAAGHRIVAGTAPLQAGAPGSLQAVVAVAGDAAQAVYLSGRLKIETRIDDGAGAPVYLGHRDLDCLSFAKRDQLTLPALADTVEETPYGRLKLIDDIDCAAPQGGDPHPYLQSGFDHRYDREPPGAHVDIAVHDILGKPARECGYGWFAYRIGRGTLTPHATYLLRIEYPEDKPRICPIEVQTGQTFMDVGWKNGVGADDPYDNWPLSKRWQWYDVIVPLDDATVGTGGTGSASAGHGFWVYAMNKMKPGAYYSMWSGGPAIAHMKLYEIDPSAHAPKIQRPAGLQQRVLAVDWERQPDHDPNDVVRYATLMGYSAISPVIIKWAQANYSEPLNGYMTVNVDDHHYWVKKPYDPAAGRNAEAPLPGQASIHTRYLAATKAWGLTYIPRFEWGGSQDLPKAAWALDAHGEPTKPNRFASWCGNLLRPEAWDDLHVLMDHLFKDQVAGNPQLGGALWRIRCDRMPISYGPSDLALFAQETGTALPAGGQAQAVGWAAGAMKPAYDAWWHLKRAQFHARLEDLLRSYRADLRLYYYNWDEDKFGLINTDITAWGFVSKVIRPGTEGGRAAYVKEREERKRFTAEEYIAVLKSGNFGEASKGVNRADYGIRPSLYHDIPGVQILAPANYRCYADNPGYLDYFRTADGLAVSNVVSYDEVGARSINPKYEGSMLTPGGPAFSMALELLAYFHGDARTLNYTVYTFGRGFADAHRRFAQAFLALPALPATIVDQHDPEVRVRLYPSANGTYIGIAHKGYQGRTITVTIPAPAGQQLTNLVTSALVPTIVANAALSFTLEVGPMELDAFLMH